MPAKIASSLTVKYRMSTTESLTLVVSVIVFLLIIGILQCRHVDQTVAFCRVRHRRNFHVTAQSVRSSIILR
jgi:Flp pilus assembly protein protease CpaA